MSVSDLLKTIEHRRRERRLKITDAGLLERACRLAAQFSRRSDLIPEYRRLADELAECESESGVR